MPQHRRRNSGKRKQTSSNLEAKELKRFTDDLEVELRAERKYELTTKVIQDLNRILAAFRKKEKS